MSLDEKNNKNTENNRVSYSEYQDLTPIDHREIGGEYLELADRTRRHDVILSDTPQNKKLAEHLKAVGYISSREEKSKLLVDSDPGKEKVQMILKLRVKQEK